MTQQKATDTLVIPLYELAEAIAQLGAGMLKEPNPGLYRHHKLEPTLIPGEQYHCRKHTGRMLDGGPGRLPVQEMVDVKHNWDAPITGDVYSLDGELLVRHNQAKYFSTTPTTNPVGFQVAVAIIDHVLNTHSNIYPATYDNRQDIVADHSVKVVQDIWEYYTKKQDPDLIHVNRVTGERTMHKASENYDMIDRTIANILGATLAVEETFRAWMGHNHWNATVINQRGTDLIIHRGRDYRITVWEAEHGSNFRRTAVGKKIR